MDTVRKAQGVRRLLPLLALLVLPLAAQAALPVAPKQSDYPATYNGQGSWCTAMMAWATAMTHEQVSGAAGYAVSSPCAVVTAGTSTSLWRFYTVAKGHYDSTQFPTSEVPPTGPTDQDICNSRPSRPGIMGSNLSICYQGCMYKPTNPLDGMDGGLRTCTAGVGAACSTQAVYKPTGGTCGDGPGGDTTPPPPPPPMPKLCGGGSCYDPNTGMGCALDANGNQVCMNVKPGAPGGCISSGDTTLCSGNPPPLPPQDKVPDPPSDIVGSDTYGQQPIDGSGNGGSVSNTTINNYNNGMSGSSTPNNGGVQGDQGTPTGGDPAPSTSTSGPPNSASGGGNCDTPPVCSGDAIQCALLSQSWSDRCEVFGLKGFLKSVYDPNGLTDNPEGEGAQGVTVDVQDLGGGTGMTGISESGWGFPNTCPLQSKSVTLSGQTVSIDYTKLCEYLDFGGMIVMILAYLAAARIIME